MCWRHLGQEVGKFGYGMERREKFLRNGERMRGILAAQCKLELQAKTTEDEDKEQLLYTHF